MPSNVQRALDVLGHQKCFLRRHKADLEKWTSKVYGINLSSDILPPDEPEESPRREELAKVKDGRSKPQQNANVGGVHRRAISVTIKCTGYDKDKKLLAEVDHGWHPRQRKTGDADKRGLRIAETENPSKRSKAADIGVKQARGDRKSSTDKVGETAEDRQAEDASGSALDIPGTPGEIWTWVEESNYFPVTTKRQQQQPLPLPEDLTLEAEDRLGRTSLVPLRACGQPAKSGSEAGKGGSGVCGFHFVGFQLRYQVVVALTGQ